MARSLGSHCPSKRPTTTLVLNGTAPQPCTYCTSKPSESSTLHPCNTGKNLKSNATGSEARATL
eukprot:4703468-Pyramimonas_sp.AAC.1